MPIIVNIMATRANLPIIFFIFYIFNVILYPKNIAKLHKKNEPTK